MVGYEQGDMIKIEGFQDLFLVVSHKRFNEEKAAMVCPLVDREFDHPLHPVVYDDAEVKHTILCEHVMFMDLSVRGYTVCGKISYGDLINAADIIQGLFDC